ncbi:hypothetical protein DXA96_13620 [Lachnospiraceae bacterium OF09-33XD]|nr:hypothetical protein DXA96_13620 [Lachnospiraceae bacterium OF09-33XD]
MDLEGEAPEGAKNIVKVPALEFDCQKVSGGRDRELESYFPDLRSRPGICVVFETEISGSDYPAWCRSWSCAMRGQTRYGCRLSDSRSTVKGAPAI